MNQHTYSFPKVTPADPRELRESLRAIRREAAADEAPKTQPGDERRTRDEQRGH
jgi:hypothetical protein